MIILDTNIVSEVMRETQDERVSRWLKNQKTLNLAVTTITIAEIERGLKRLPAGRRRKGLESSFQNFITLGFEGRVLAFDKMAADLYGEICAKREKKGYAVDPVDLMIVAIAKNAGASIATRNTDDFVHCGVKLVNPWKI